MLPLIVVALVVGLSDAGVTRCPGYVQCQYANQAPIVSRSQSQAFTVRFSCRGRVDGLYADLDNNCEVYHFCKTTKKQNADSYQLWSYAQVTHVCQFGQVFDQQLAKCVEPGQTITKCTESELYYPALTDLTPASQAVPPLTEARLVPVKCPPGEEQKCQLRNGVIELPNCQEAPGSIQGFRSWSTTGSVPARSGYGQLSHRPSIQQGVYQPGQGSGLSSSPSINQRLGQPGQGSAISSNPRISQGLGQPGLGSNLDHNPRINQNVGQPNVGSNLAHNPSISQTVGQPGSGYGLSSNPRISQGIGQPNVGSSLSHNPSISQNVGQPGSGSNVASNPRISQGLGQPGSASSLAHNPSINQVIGTGGAPRLGSRPLVPSGESAEADYLGLPLGSTRLVGKIDTSFDCTGRPYGFYGDVRNACKVYHVCSPKTDEYGKLFYEHYSFVCNTGTVFDQKILACVEETKLTVPCHLSEQFYPETAARFAAPAAKPLASIPEPVLDTPVGAAKPQWFEAISHNPRISQGIGQPGSGSSLAHNPSINQVVGQPGSSSRLAHNPSINQDISQPGYGSALASNPRISQGLGQGGGYDTISHNPSIRQTINGYGGGDLSRSYPSVAAANYPGDSSSSVSHQPSIRQTIVRSAYDRPAGRG
ncbi:hypothetical protein HDE_04083 [Halotydeus destructor]|nr:hypothetical protein HDE_04083 [Halotydeus destructor]